MAQHTSTSDGAIAQAEKSTLPTIPSNAQSVQCRSLQVLSQRNKAKIIIQRQTYKLLPTTLLLPLQRWCPAVEPPHRNGGKSGKASARFFTCCVDRARAKMIKPPITLPHHHCRITMFTTKTLHRLRNAMQFNPSKLDLLLPNQTQTMQPIIAFLLHLWALSSQVIMHHLYPLVSKPIRYKLTTQLAIHPSLLPPRCLACSAPTLNGHDRRLHSCCMTSQPSPHRRRRRCLRRP